MLPVGFMKRKISVDSSWVSKYANNMKLLLFSGNCTKTVADTWRQVIWSFVRLIHGDIKVAKSEVYLIWLNSATNLSIYININKTVKYFSIKIWKSVSKVNTRTLYRSIDGFGGFWVHKQIQRIHCYLWNYSIVRSF